MKPRTFAEHSCDVAFAEAPIVSNERRSSARSARRKHRASASPGLATPGRRVHLPLCVDQRSQMATKRFALGIQLVPRPRRPPG